jgi:hypothetical protein
MPDATSELLWVAVPGGTVLPTGAVLRTLVVPRLAGLPDDADLAAYGFADWPARLASATLRVERADDAGSGLSELAATRQAPPAGIGPSWKEVFAPDHPVRAYAPPPAYDAPNVDPSATHARVIRGIYTTAATKPGEAVDATDPSLALPPPSAPTQQTGAPAIPPPDFHRVVTMLREHPNVLTGLGLIVELHLPDVDALRAGGVVRIRCELDQLEHEVVSRSPWTRYELSAERFLPAPSAGSDIEAGMVNLDPARWSFETFDVTGAVDRLRDQESRGPAASAGSLPALRSAGLSLMRHDRVEQLNSRIAEGARNTGGAGVADDLVLDADHLVLGYRVDIRSSSSGWRSAMRRRASYAAAAGDLADPPTLVEEGQVKANAVTVEGSRQARELDDEKQLPALRADEMVVRWDGWSLTCPKPGAGPAPGGAQLSYLAWSFEPVELPLLRFGQAYNVRIRVADAAGGGLGLEDPEPTEQESKQVFYGRHDPVRPPLVVPGEAAGPGDAADVLVIRSDPQAGRGVADFAAQFAANDERMLLPPSASWLLIDQHGHFGDHQDPVLPGEPDEQTYAAWLARSLAPETHAPDGTYSWLPDPLAEGIAITIRPDPGNPAPKTTKQEAWKVPTGEWPDFPFKTLALEELTAGHSKRLDWTDGHRRGVVRLAPGEQVSIDLTSTVVSDRTDLLAMENWLKDPVGIDGDPSEPSISQLMELVRAGRHPMVSPPHVVRLVHAVPHPVTAPSGELRPGRVEAASTVDLIPSPPPAPPPGGPPPGSPEPLVELGVHVPSSGQIELRASWTEVFDTAEPQEVRDLPVQLLPLAPDALALPPLRHELGDTRHRMITYSLSAISRYRDYFAPSDDPAAFAGPPFEQIVDVPSTARPPAPTVVSVTPAFRWQGTDLPPGWTDLTRTREGGIVRVELARPWLASGEDELLAVLVDQGAGVPQTTFRRDPIWQTELPPPADDSAFVATAGDPVTLPLPEAGAVTAYSYRPTFDPGEGTDGHWVAHVHLPAVAEISYGAFVSLVLARYQPHSLESLHLSPAVRAEPVQLAPRRTLQITRSPTAVQVTLTGLTPTAPQPRVDIHLEELPIQAGHPDATAVDPALNIGWRRLTTVSGAIDEQLTVPLPASVQPLRIVVREVENLTFDPPSDAEHELRDRVPFLDVIPLD